MLNDFNLNVVNKDPTYSHFWVNDELGSSALDLVLNNINRIYFSIKYRQDYPIMMIVFYTNGTVKLPKKTHFGIRTISHLI